MCFHFKAFRLERHKLAKPIFPKVWRGKGYSEMVELRNVCRFFGDARVLDWENEKEKFAYPDKNEQMILER